MIRYFVFDQFNPSSPTDYWKTEPDVEVPDWVSHIAEEEEFIPLFEGIKSSEWSDDDFIAVMKICRERAYLFRIYSGGVDVFGRLNRWVILLAEGERKDFTGTDILSAADSGIFADFKSLSRETNVEVPENIGCRKMTDILQNFVSGELEISDVNTLQKVSLVLSSRDDFTGTIRMQKLGGKLVAKTFVRPTENGGNESKNQIRETLVPDDNKSASQNVNSTSKALCVLGFLFAFLLGALFPAWQWFEVRQDYAHLAEENKKLHLKMSQSQGSYGRVFKGLKEKCSDLESQNQKLRKENKQLNERLHRAEGIVNAVEELRRCVYVFRENLDSLTETISDSVSRANFNGEEDD